MKYGTLETTFEYPPIPDRSMDWSAHEDPEGYIGRGPTEIAAVIDYFEHGCEELRGELDAADRRISEGAKWIPVGERKPEPMVDVLLYAPGSHKNYAVGYWWRDGLGGFPAMWMPAHARKYQPTHWMSLPKAPK